MPYLRHLSTSVDLITAPEEIRAGFVALALERSRRATPLLSVRIPVVVIVNRKRGFYEKVFYGFSAGDDLSVGLW